MPPKLSLIPILSILILSGCGGSSVDLPPLFSSLTYSGAETQTAIRLQNAPDLVEEMFGNRGFIADPDDPASHPEPYHILIPLALTQAIQRVNQETANELGTTETDLGEVIDCDSGYLDYAITVDDLDGSFSGEMTFHDCESATIILAGEASISGVYDLGTITFQEMILSFPVLTGRNKTFRVTSNGHFEVLLDDPIRIALYDYTIQNRADGPIVKFDDFTLILTEQNLVTTLTLTGRFYHPDHGYGLVSTPNPISFTANVYWPLFGQIIIDGVDSSLQALFDDSNQYTLFVDANGDNTTFETVVGYWEQP
jgi:hypothetical protein